MPILGVLGRVFVYRIEPSGRLLAPIVGAIFVGLFLWTAVWVIKRKNQSILWLLFLILPIVGVFILLLLDKHKQRQETDGKSLSKVE
jgi:uncharacterized membrane protein YeaQ/YmgE (transglycosylase-associated protein family)